jgi:hypothetical protein
MTIAGNRKFRVDSRARTRLAWEQARGALAMADGTPVSKGASPARLGKGPGGTAGARARAADAFADLEATEGQAKAAPWKRADTKELRSEPKPPDPTPSDLVKKVEQAQEDRAFSIVKSPDGKTTVRLSGRVDPAVYQDQKLPVPRQELRAYAQSTQQWAMLVRSFEVSVVQIQALVATKLKAGQITRAEAQEALKAQFAGARPDSAIPVLKFLGEHPEYQDLFGIQAKE